MHHHAQESLARAVRRQTSQQQPQPAGLDSLASPPMSQTVIPDVTRAVAEITREQRVQNLEVTLEAPEAQEQEAGATPRRSPELRTSNTLQRALQQQERLQLQQLLQEEEEEEQQVEEEARRQRLKMLQVNSQQLRQGLSIKDRFQRAGSSQLGRAAAEMEEEGSGI